MDCFLGATGDGVGLILFLDVSVEAVVHHLDVGMIHVADEFRGLSGGGQEVDFEAVEIFDREPDLSRLGLFADALHRLDPRLVFVRRGPLPRENADRRVGGTAEDLATERLTAFENAVEMGHGVGADGGVRGDGIGLGAHHGDGRGSQAETGKPFPKPFVRGEARCVEDRNLDRVEADRLDLL